MRNLSLRGQTSFMGLGLHVLLSLKKILFIDGPPHISVMGNIERKGWPDIWWKLVQRVFADV